MKTVCKVEVNNMPDISAKYVVARFDENTNALWFWGSWERKEKAAKTIARLRKKGANLSPVEIEGRTIARTFWGKAWCDNIESYRDYAYRLEAGAKEENVCLDM